MNGGNNMDVEMLYLLDLKTDIEVKLSQPEKLMPWQIAMLEVDLDTVNKEIEKLGGAK